MKLSECDVGGYYFLSQPREKQHDLGYEISSSAGEGSSSFPARLAYVPNL